jgi:glyoxylase-like metal-dependent hydrolase (beta-lactamase superfamily II)
MAKIFTLTLGDMAISTLAENTGPGNTGILLEKDPAVLNRYIPPEGFKSGMNAFLIRSGGKAYLADTAFGGPLFEHLAALDVKPQDIGGIFITHLHGDHYMGLSREGKRNFPNALVYLAEAELNWAKNAPKPAAPTPMGSALDALAPYGDDVKTFTPGALGVSLEELVPGIGAIAAYGHTPGHCAYLLRSGDKSLLIIGDLLHVAPVQFPRPDISASFDADSAQAALTRRLILSYAAEQGIPVAGMHIADPAIGTVKAAPGGFTFTPCAHL